MILLFDNLIEGRNLAALRLLLKHQKNLCYFGKERRGEGVWESKCF